MNSEKLMNLLSQFEKLSRFGYWEDARWNKAKEDPWASLRLLLSDYAFEHQGVSQDYSPAAVDTIDEINSSSLSEDIASVVWDSFKKKLKPKGLNEMNNSLCPKGEKYERKDGDKRTPRTTKKVSIIQFAAKRKELPIVAWAYAMMEGEKLKDAYAELQKINGIGPKIASLFLRDLAVYFKLEPKENRRFLQPVDTWIRFVVQAISDNPKADDGECAQFIVDNSKAPERVNQGIWYFCSDMADSSQYVVGQNLKDPNYFKGRVEKYIESLERDAEIAKKARAILEWTS